MEKGVEFYFLSANPLEQRSHVYFFVIIQTLFISRGAKLQCPKRVCFERRFIFRFLIIVTALRHFRRKKKPATATRVSKTYEPDRRTIRVRRSGPGLLPGTSGVSKVCAKTTGTTTPLCGRRKSCAAALAPLRRFAETKNRRRNEKRNWKIIQKKKPYVRTAEKTKTKKKKTPRNDYYKRISNRIDAKCLREIEIARRVKVRRTCIGLSVETNGARTTEKKTTRIKLRRHGCLGACLRTPPTAEQPASVRTNDSYKGA